MLRQIRRRRQLTRRRAHNDSMKAEYKRYAAAERDAGREPEPRRLWEADRAKSR